MIIRAPQCFRGIAFMHFRAWWTGIDLVSTWHFVPICGVYFKWWDDWGLFFCWNIKMYRVL